MNIYDHISNDPAKTADQKADEIVKIMIVAAVLSSVIPAHANWMLIVSILGGGTVAIGNVYGVELDGPEAWKLVKQFFLAAGFTFMALAVGSKLIAAILSSTGHGHAPAIVLDGTVSAAIAYAVGKSGQAYFKGERDKGRLGQVFRDAFLKKQAA